MTLMDETTEMRPYRITAVVTTYNRPAGAKRAIRSIANQTYQPAEIIVVEDGSQSDLAEWLASSAPRPVEYIRHESNKGLAAARNTGLRKATGDYIAYLDDDDEWKPNRLERQVELLSQLNAEERDALAVIYGGIELYTVNDDGVAGGKPVELSPNVPAGNLQEAVKEHGLRTFPSTMLFVRGALEAVGGHDESLLSSVDHDIWMSLASAGYSSAHVRSPLVTVRMARRRKAMTVATQNRLKGICQFVDKWTPVFMEWFGPREGQVFAERYLARVVATLAAEKLSVGRFGEAQAAIRLMFERSKQWQFNMRILVQRIVAQIGLWILPRPLLLEIRRLRQRQR